METVKLTKAEINHIMSLITDNEINGIYSGNRKAYWKRSLDVKHKLRPNHNTICPLCSIEHDNVEFGSFCSLKCLDK
jgi:hypothetical protein